MTPQEAVREARRRVDQSEWAQFARAAHDAWQANRRPPEFSPEPGWLLADTERAAKRAKELGLPIAPECEPTAAGVPVRGEEG